MKPVKECGSMAVQVMLKRLDFIFTLLNAKIGEDSVKSSGEAAPSMAVTRRFRPKPTRWRGQWEAWRQPWWRGGMEVGSGWTEESSAGEIMNRSRKDPGFLDWVP